MPHGFTDKRSSSCLSLSFLLILALNWLLFAALLATPQSALAQENQFYMEEYNADITVNTDGSLDVTEELVYSFDRGRFRRGLREIPLNRVEGIGDVTVVEVEGGQEIEYSETSFNPDDGADYAERGTFGTSVEGDTLRIRWIFSQPAANETKVFLVRYRADGAVRVYSDRDELDWFAVPQEWASSISSSRVSVTLPDGVDASTLETAVQPQGATVTTQGNTIEWAVANPGNGVEVGVQLPKGVLQASVPSWQASIDQEERQKAEWERTRPLFELGALVLGVLLAASGVLWGIMRWYRQGRDKPVKLLSDYITEPSSKLPPGLVGTLLDESADVREVIATLVDLARKGNLTMRQVEEGSLFSQKDFEYAQTGNAVEFRYEEMVLNAVFSKGSPVRLSELKNSFYKDLPPIYDEMYKSLVALKYFPENPKAVRSRNMGLGFGLLFLGAAAIFLPVMLLENVGLFFFCPGAALALSGLVWMMMSRAMPRKTDFGSEETQKWLAFKRYLQQMRQYTNVQAAADKFQQYLPYAVALGVERELINQFDSVPAAMPPWYAPYGYTPFYPYPYTVGAPVGSGQSVGGGWSGNEGMGAGPGGGGAGFDPAGMAQGMSDSLASSMQGMSDSFTSMVNSASSALTSQPSSSGSGGGGGWGGGGGSFGGGGGGGGGGGAD